MPLTFACLIPCSSSSSVEVATQPTTTTFSSSSSSSDSIISTSSSLPTSTSFDDNFSLQTFPSLPSLQLQSFLPSSSPSSSSSLSTSILLLYSLPSTTTTNNNKNNKPVISSPALAFSPSSNHLYSSSGSQTTLYSTSTPTPTASFPSPSSAGAVKSISLSPDSERIFTAHQDGRIRVYNRRHRLVATLPTAFDRLRRLPLPSNYVPVRRHRRRLWIEHADAVSALAARPGLLYSVSWDRTLKVWRLPDLRCLESIPAHDDAINAVAVAPDGTVYTGSADRRVRVWARPAGARRHSLVATLERHRSAVNALAIGGGGSVLYSGACDRSILVWEREDSANFMVVAGLLRGHRGPVLCLACAGEMLFSGSGDRTVRVWRRGGEGREYSCLAVVEGHVRGVRSVAVAVAVASDEEDPDSSEGEEYRVCSGSLDGEVRVWRVRVSGVKRSAAGC